MQKSKLFLNIQSEDKLAHIWLFLPYNGFIIIWHNILAKMGQNWHIYVCNVCRSLGLFFYIYERDIWKELFYIIFILPQESSFAWMNDWMWMINEAEKRRCKYQNWRKREKIHFNREELTAMGSGGYNVLWSFSSLEISSQMQIQSYGKEVNIKTGLRAER